MEWKVRIFIDGQRIKPSDMSKLTISNPTIDRIVNDIVDRIRFEDSQQEHDALSP